MEQQMALPALPTKQIRARAFRGRRRKRIEDEARAEGGEATPRCLRGGVRASKQELQEGLEQAMEVMRAYSSAIKEDVLMVREICPINNPRARRFLKQWGAEKLCRVLEDLMFSLVVVAFERWRQKVQFERKLERISSYLKFQSSQRIRRVFEAWVQRHMLGAWVKWRRMVKAQKEYERNTLELRSAMRIQRLFRGHAARMRVRRIKQHNRALFERANAVRIQAWWRGTYTRLRLHQILRDKERSAAAVKIQAIARAR